MAINDPRDIPSLWAWYSAEAETTYSDGDAMTSWTDLSGNGRHATQTTGAAGGPKWRSAGGPGGGPSVEFMGVGQNSTSGYFSINNALNGASAGEAVFYVKADALTNNGWNRFDGGGDNSHYPFSGTVYDKFLSTVRKSFTPSLAVTSWRRYNTWSASGDWGAELDNTAQYSTTSNTVSLPGTGYIGRGVAAGDWGFGGRMTCLLLFSAKLSTTDRSDLDDWLVANPSGGTI